MKFKNFKEVFAYLQNRSTDEIYTVKMPGNLLDGLCLCYETDNCSWGIWLSGCAFLCLENMKDEGDIELVKRR